MEISLEETESFKFDTSETSTGVGDEGADGEGDGSGVRGDSERDKGSSGESFNAFSSLGCGRLEGLYGISSSISTSIFLDLFCACRWIRIESIRLWRVVDSEVTTCTLRFEVFVHRITALTHASHFRFEHAAKGVFTRVSHYAVELVHGMNPIALRFGRGEKIVQLPSSIAMGFFPGPIAVTGDGAI
ncbi:hypothetical protein LENED_006181 [Lentinula edodes]|uniref:Uncharacterized protein n=1 Tax=Lentinula edodes TaxID=5353 RepID=A0A1Q3EBC0_LENED|nr:hypothetical protein LENED_006181 [Lentinula edodes]